MSNVQVTTIATRSIATRPIATRSIGGAPSQYSVNGLEPGLVADFESNLYFANTSAISLSTSFTHARSSNATMVDSDGLLKWAPHNLLTYSDDPSTSFSSNVDSVWFDANTLFATAQAGIQSPYAREPFTFLSAGTYTFEFEVTDSNIQFATINLQVFDAGANGLSVFDIQSGSVDTQASNHTASISTTPDGYLCKIVFSLDGSDLSGIFDLGISEQTGVNRITDPTGSEYAAFRRLRLYRSDLGGMVDNPDRGDSYVPTTSSALYLPRIGHHVYNGSAWVNEGYLHESESRTNLLANSADITSGGEIRATTVANMAISPDGTLNAGSLIEDSTPASTHYTQFNYATDSVARDYCFSAFVKANTAYKIQLDEGSVADNPVQVDLATGTIHSIGGNVKAGLIQEYGNGWYRVSLAINTATSFFRAKIQILGDDYSLAYDGDGTSGIYIYGPQLEEGSTPSSYIPTSGSTVTRSADTMTASNLPWPSPTYAAEFETSSWTGVNWDTFTTDGATFSGEKTTGGGTDVAYSDAIVEAVLGEEVYVEVDFAPGTNTQARINLSSNTNARSTYVDVNPSEGGTFGVYVYANVFSGTFSIYVSTTQLGTINVTGARAKTVTFFVDQDGWEDDVC